uniref:Uncharacterized protein n=1 Tax=Aegilops tauschii subsp. strangulata TaxID=200361 RepID=A0A453RN72_AEGTS
PATGALPIRWTGPWSPSSCPPQLSLESLSFSPPPKLILPIFMTSCHQPPPLLARLRFAG